MRPFAPIKATRTVFIQEVASKASNVVRKRAMFASVIEQRGSRHSAEMAPRQASAVFTGTGLDSMNKSLNNGSNFRCISRAVFTSPDRKAWTSAQTSAGNKFDAT